MQIIAKLLKNFGYQDISNSVKKHFLVLIKLCNFKVQCLDVPMEKGNLATLLNCCEKLF